MARIDGRIAKFDDLVRWVRKWNPDAL